MRWTRGLSTLVLLGLVLTSGVLVLILDSSALVSPMLPIRGSGGNPNQGPTGILVVTLYTDLNVTNPFADPRPGASNPIGEQSLGVYRASNTSTLVVPLFTSVNGIAVARLSPDDYVVKMARDSQNIAIPVRVNADNVTRLTVRVVATSYPVSYAEVSAASPTALSYHETLYVQIHAPSTAAKFNDTVLVKLRGGATGQIANATVTGVQQAGDNVWLVLDSAYSINPVSATEMTVTTYTYSYTTNYEPTSLYVQQQ